MTDPKNDKARKEEFLTKLFITVGEKSCPNMKLDVPKENLPDIAAAQAAHFQRDYR